MSTPTEATVEVVDAKAVPEVTRSRDYRDGGSSRELEEECDFLRAIRRIRAQLEKGDEKLCWFLVSDISLGQEKYETLKESLPPVNIQLLSSDNDVEKWKDREIWDKVLALHEKTSTIVVSTHQVLLDALTDGFVEMQKIGLLVFDEVYCYAANHPASRIIQEFHKAGELEEFPAVLGIAKAPAIGEDPPQPRVVEFTLDAISSTPIPRCEELPENTQQPKLVEEEENQEDSNTKDEDEDAINESKHLTIHIESTGALLTFESAITDLQDFCTTLPQAPYTDLHPIFTTNTESSLYRATVTLPNCLPLAVRHAVSKRAWRTKTWAKRDAAFHAYLALYSLEDPLVNSYLLPLFKYPVSSTTEKPTKKKKRAKAMVERTLDPWVGMRWAEGTVVYATCVTLRMPDSSRVVELDMLTPVECPAIERILVYWKRAMEYEVVVGESRCLGVDPELVAKARKMTYRLLQTVFRSKMTEGVMDFPYLFMPKDPDEDWEVEDEILTNALEAYTKYGPDKDIGLLRDITQNGTRHILRSWRTDISPLNNAEITKKYGEKPINPTQPLIEAVKLPERRDFLHEVTGDTPQEITVLLLPEYCTVYKVPWYYSKLALLLPGIIRRIEIALIASDLQRTLLAPVGIQSVSKIITAICAPSAREPTDYQRFEFLGDLVLKFLTSVNLLDEHPFWHEGYLSFKKSKLVSNSSLARVAEDKGLARWVITDTFTGLKWRPRYVIPETTVDAPAGEKELSTKVLADVVEAIIGAAYLEGGYEKALKCIATFGLGVNWESLEARINSLATRAVGFPTVSISYLRGMEKLLGYEFKNQALLVEAITHPGCELGSVSYERLQFLGDALLDMVVVQEIFFDPTLLSPVDMHLFKSSVVSGNFLAFLSMGYSISLGYPKVQPSESGAEKFEVVTKERVVNFWQFVDLPHPGMADSKRKCVDKYESGLREKVQTALDTGIYYPWAELSVFEADTRGKTKFFSDIIEAVLGAVFVDSGGDFEVVKGIVEGFGVLQALRRFVKDRVKTIHPVTRLDETVAPMQKGRLKYVMDFEDGEFVCTILFNNSELAIARSSSKAESRAVAAEIGLKELERPTIKSEEGVSGEIDEGW